MSYPLETFAERAWFAYLALPRVGKHPIAMSKLENRIDKKTGRQMGRADGPSPATFNKLFDGSRVEPRKDTREAIARVLGVSLQWLDYGMGDPPRLNYPYTPMKRDESLREHDPAEWARKYAAIGGVEAAPNNFQIAVLFLGSTLTGEAIEEVAAKARGRESDLTSIGWAKLLNEAQAKRAPAAKKKPEAKAPEPSTKPQPRRKAS